VNRRAWWAAAAVAAVVVCYLGYRLFVHASSGPAPAVITPKMDVHRAVSMDLDARFARLLHERYSGDRSGRPRLIALTFDDGPYPVTTPLLLDVLRDLRVPATFFLIGRDAEQFPDLARRIEREGNEIGNHTYAHPSLDKLSSAAVSAELIKGRAVLRTYAADRGIETLFRPPHGRYTEAALLAAQRLGYYTILSTDEGGDWRNVGPTALALHIEAHATAPEIVLLHSGNLATIAMLPEVVARFHKSGYQFVTVSRLLARVPPQEINHPARRAV
jgi:peptidoglycan/xylan/chitin deacetylase (PgdA/CDA1 family)